MEMGTCLCVPFRGERQVLTERCRDGSSVMLMTPDACPITDILAASACTADVARNSLYLCCKLQLDKKDPDSADGLWKRCFAIPLKRLHRESAHSISGLTEYWIAGRKF